MLLVLSLPLLNYNVKLGTCFSSELREPLVVLCTGTYIPFPVTAFSYSTSEKFGHTFLFNVFFFIFIIFCIVD